ncbi:LysR family transcriptional regulator [uncultured Cohaesibacter sp.]|uniref:LysR family transcriptional regulator n=1 Tax=uncultured Cohaesibacter sp. TaxID=1002546 RepID=UPI0029C8A6AC|nr:LysR family transcriptional regulator [uncultured Cohaesibacter sp.]
MTEKKILPTMDAFVSFATGPNRPVAGGAVQWNDLFAFLAIARHGGLSMAARETGSSAPTLGRRMRALERTLGRELFVRHTHGYELTEAGLQLQDQLRPAEDAIARATLPAPEDGLPLVKIAAGTWTMLTIAEALSRITGAPPDLRVRLLQGEDVLSIRRREASVGFRSQRPTQTGLAARRMRRVTFAPFAAPGAPDRWIVVQADTPSARWVRERCGDRIAAEVNIPRLALDLMLAGVGRALLPTFVGLGRAGLEQVGADIDDLCHDQWLVSHEEDRYLPEVRRTLDRIGEVFG